MGDKEGNRNVFSFEKNKLVETLLRVINNFLNDAKFKQFLNNFKIFLNKILKFFKHFEKSLKNFKIILK